MQRAGIIAGADPVKVALANLADSKKSGILFVGPAGCGKTFVLGAAVDAVRSSAKMSSQVTLVVRRPSHRRELGTLLEPVPGRPSSSGFTRSVVAADDLDSWTPGALRLLAEAVDSRQVQLIGTARADAVERLMGAFRPALSPGIVGLEPWRRSDLDRHAEAVLQGSLHPLTAAGLLDFAGGNQLCLVELLEQGRGTARLHRRYETWTWSGEVPVPPVTFARTWEVLRHLPDAALEVIACLGLVGRASLGWLRRVHPLDALQAAEAQHCITVTAQPSGDVEVALTRPVEGRVVLSARPMLQQRALCERLLAALEVAEGDEAPVVAIAGLCRHVGVTVPWALAESAAETALREHDPQLAIDLLTPSARGRRAAALLASALSDQCRFDSAAEVLAAYMHDEGQTIEGDSDGAARLAALSVMAKPAVKEKQRNATPASSYSICVAVWTGQNLAEATAQGRALIAASSSPTDHERCAAATMWGAIQLGQVDEAIDTNHGVLAPADASSITLARLTALGYCHLLRGAMREAKSVANELCDLGMRQRWPLAHATGSFLSGRCALAQAQPVTAISRLAESLPTFIEAAPTFSNKLVLGSLALAYLLAGRPADCVAVQREADREEAGMEPDLMRALADLTFAELLNVQGHRGMALEIAETVATGAQAAGQPLLALLGFHLLVRIQPSPARTQGLAQASSGLEFPLVETYLRHARAAEHADAPELEKVSGQYEESGLLWLAAETAAAALASAPDNSSPPWTFRAKKRIGMVQAEEQLVAPAWWGTAADRVAPLTSREREIAEAVALGSTSAEIAAQLSLSKRTVENHVQHVYRKLGITRRSELKAALNSIGYHSRKP